MRLTKKRIEKISAIEKEIKKRYAGKDDMLIPTIAYLLAEQDWFVEKIEKMRQKIAGINRPKRSQTN